MKPTYNHMCLTVSDLERSIAFYERFLGLKAVRRDAPHTGEKVDKLTGVVGGELLAAFVSDGDFTLELLQFTRQVGESVRAPMPNQVGAPHMGFVCDDVRTVHAEWAAQGVRFVSEPLYSPKRDKWVVMALDPDGVMIELIEHTALTAEQTAQARA